MFYTKKKKSFWIIYSWI